MQYINETSLALANYVTSYVTKAEKSHMQDLWQEISETKSVFSRLWNFGLRCIRSRESGLYEASDMLLGDHLSEKSDTVQWINVSMSPNRRRKLVTYRELQALAETIHQLTASIATMYVTHIILKDQHILMTFVFMIL